MEADTIHATVTDATMAAKVRSNGFYDTTKQINLQSLRRMLNEGQQDGEGEDEEEGEEEEMDMESSSEINIEAHEGMYINSF